MGHGTLGRDELAGLLRTAGVDALVDIRRAPGSRRNPDVARAALERWVPEAGVSYRWEPRLGGWRRPRADSPNTALGNDSFRGYADYMGSEDFRAALSQVLDEAEHGLCAVMCSEAVYWRCHRRLVADAAVLLHGARVQHLGHDGSLLSHRLTDGVRVEGSGLVYDAEADGGVQQRLPVS